MNKDNFHPNKVIAIVGPTAVGKTAMSIELAKKLNGEIISGDSMQIYRGMDIGTGKVKETEMAGIPHHLIDIKSPKESFSVYEFQHLVRRKIDHITAKNKTPIIVGGTGLYIQSVLYDYNFSKEGRNKVIQARLEAELREYGNEAMYQKLMAIDSKHAKRIHPNNYRRVIRALEVYETTGKTMTETEQLKSKGANVLYPHFLVGLTMARDVLYDRINNRVDKMIEEGLIKEVYSLYQSISTDSQSFQAIGYKEFIPYFKGHIKEEEAILNLKQNSRRYAKRQYTYFKNKMNVHWYDVTSGSPDQVLKCVYDDCYQFLYKNL